MRNDIPKKGGERVIEKEKHTHFSETFLCYQPT